jgi:maltose alpha-D-glucosyltransferase/alpha-amylase
LPDFQTLVVRDSLRELLGERHTSTILRDILPDYLRRRRWFAGKDEKIAAVRVAYIVPLPSNQEMLISEIEVQYQDRLERYLIPAGISWEGGAALQLPQQLALARVRRKRQVGFITDAFSLEGFPRALVGGLRNQLRIATPDGEIQFVGTDQVNALPDMSEAGVRWLSAEQSNSSLVLGNAAVIKLIRKVLPGIHPEAEMTGYLTKVGYRNASQLLGEVVRIAGDGAPHTLAIVQSNIANQGDAWTWTVDNLRRAVDEAALAPAEGANEESFKPLFDFAALVGTRLGELHIALAGKTSDPAFAPAYAKAADIRKIAAATAKQIERTCARLQAKTADLDAEAQSLVAAIIDKKSEIISLLGALAKNGAGTLMTRVHGDFHLGQILVAQADAYIIDFEGEPLRGLEERRAKTTPLRDVAGLLRSLDYAAASVDLPEGDASSQPVRERRADLLRSFRHKASDGFLSSYWAAVSAFPALRLSPTRGGLLDLLLLEKGAYEIEYEAANRPKWLPIPLRGFAALVNQLTRGDKG